MLVIYPSPIVLVAPPTPLVDLCIVSKMTGVSKAKSLEPIPHIISQAFHSHHTIGNPIQQE